MDPDPNGWQTYTLTASDGSRTGFSPTWTGCGSVASGACIVTLDEDRDVTVGWVDTTDPVLNTLSVTNAVGGRVGRVAQVSATATDNAGVARVEWFLGSSPTPVLTDASAPFSGTIDVSSVADATMRCALTGTQTVAAAPCAGSYSPIGPDSPDGSYTYTVTATDAVANTASATRSFVLDRTPPALSFTEGPTEGQLVGTPTLGFSFTETEANPQALDCRLDGAAVGCSPGAPLTLEGLTNGSHAFTVHATDKAGNERTITRNFAVSLPGSAAGGSAGNNPATGTDGNAAATDNHAAATDNTQPQRLVVSLKAPRQRALKMKNLVLGFTSNQAFKVTAKVRLHGKVIAKFSKNLRSGKTTVEVRLGRKALAQLRKALHKQKTTKLVLKLTYAGAGGAKTQRSEPITVRR